MFFINPPNLNRKNAPGGNSVVFFSPCFRFQPPPKNKSIIQRFGVSMPSFFGPKVDQRPSCRWSDQCRAFFSCGGLARNSPCCGLKGVVQSRGRERFFFLILVLCPLANLSLAFLFSFLLLEKVVDGSAMVSWWVRKEKIRYIIIVKNQIVVAHYGNPRINQNFRGWDIFLFWHRWRRTSPWF